MSSSRKGGRRKTVKNNYSYLKHLHEGEPIFVVSKNTHGHVRLATRKKITFRKDCSGNKHFLLGKKRYSASGIAKSVIRRQGPKNTQSFNGPRHLGMCVTRTHRFKGPHVVRIRDLTAAHKRCSASQAAKLLQLIRWNTCAILSCVFQHHLLRNLWHGGV